MKKTILTLVLTLISIYLIICCLLYFYQEKLLFFPHKLPVNYTFNFEQNFEEVTILTEDNIKLHGLHFKTDSSKGLIFYLHGNAGSLSSWGKVAKTYTNLNYDVFILDYRGYGKSEGTISGETELYNDMQSAYNYVLDNYKENEIIIIGYSLGTGLAVKLASENSPSKLILQAPYISMIDMMKNTYPLVPTVLLKYKLESNKYITECKMPIVLFHGNDDEVIYYNSSVKLMALLKETDRLITLQDQAHNGMTDNAHYIKEIENILK